jgi:hypothetical protein
MIQIDIRLSIYIIDVYLAVYMDCAIRERGHCLEMGSVSMCSPYSSPDTLWLALYKLGLLWAILRMKKAVYLTKINGLGLNSGGAGGN